MTEITFILENLLPVSRFYREAKWVIINASGVLMFFFFFLSHRKRAIINKCLKEEALISHKKYSNKKKDYVFALLFIDS